MLVVEIRNVGDIGVTEPAIEVEGTCSGNREKSEEVTDPSGPSC